MNTMDHKGYIGSAEIDLEGQALVGKLLFIRDTITYSATDIAGLRRAFEEAVDDYLATCEELGDEPDLPCKGTFNVRVGPQRHRQLALEARQRHVSINDYVCQALDASFQSPLATRSYPLDPQVMSIGGTAGIRQRGAVHAMEPGPVKVTAVEAPVQKKSRAPRKRAST